MDRGAWQATVHGVAKSLSDTTEQLTQSSFLKYVCIWSLKVLEAAVRIFTTSCWLLAAACGKIEYWHTEKGKQPSVLHAQKDELEMD